MCYYHNKDLILCSYCSSIINNYYNNRLMCTICMNTSDLIIICFLCNKSYSIFYINEFCNYYSYYVNKIQQWYKLKKIKKKIHLYSDYILDQYYNPNSEYIKYLVNNFDKNIDNIKQIAYINNNNNLKFFKLNLI